MDDVRVEVCTSASCATAYTVFYWGDGTFDANTSFAGLPICAGEPDNCQVTNGYMYNGSGIQIDVDAVAPPGTYTRIRLWAPAYNPPTITDGAEGDALATFATPPPTPTNTANTTT